MSENAGINNYDLEGVEDLNVSIPCVAAENPLEKALKRITELRSRYPLSLTKEECLALEKGDRNTWKFYLEDTMRDGKYQVVENPAAAKWDADARRAVSVGQPCPACGGHGGTESRALYSGDRSMGGIEVVCRGIETNFYFTQRMTCWCVDFKDFRELVEKKLPERLRGFNLDTLTASPKSALDSAAQEKELAFIRQHPDDSYFFLGKPGTSKTTYATALYRAALFKAFKKPDAYGGRMHYATKCIWRVNGNRLFEQEVAYATADDKSSVERDITVEDIIRAKRNGHRPTLLLEEIDKRKMTEFAANVLFRLIDAMDETGGQIIVTTNRTMKGFMDMFAESEVEAVRITGEALVRRLTEPDKIHVRDYHNET